MFRRRIDGHLEKWAEGGPGKCLLVKGPRRVGKTTAIREFGKTYDSFVELDLQNDPSGRMIFSCEPNINFLLMMFAVYMPDARFVPGRTLLFLDEIQECPEALRSLPFWEEDGRFDVIASMSVPAHSKRSSAPVPEDSVPSYGMRAMSFEEFLWANGQQTKMIESLRLFFLSRRRVPEALNFRMMELLRSYMVVGGMPEAVETFISGGSVFSCHEKQQEILKNIQYDIVRCAPPEVRTKAEKCYLSLPLQLSKENRKFQYSELEKGGNARKYKSSLDWLLKAFLVVRSDAVERIELPLSDCRSQDNFRLYASDIGLLTAMYDFVVSDQLLKDEFDRTMAFVRGGLYEALIADILYKNSHSSLCFKKDTKGSFEMEFIIEENGQAVPVEVKPRNSRSKSLDLALSGEGIPYGYRLTEGNIEVSGKRISLPLYMAMFL